MKKLIAVLMLLLLTGMLVACDSGTNSNNMVPNQDFQKYLTLQGKIMDALTGNGVGGSDLQVFLIQGVSNRSADKLVTDVNNALVGEYAFANIPASMDGNITFKIVAVKGGYQRFEGEVAFGVNVFDTLGNGTVDNVYNWIGNIYLYPTSASSGDVDVYVYSPAPQSIPVPGAKVHLVQNIANNDLLVNAGNPNTIPATNGLVSDLSATTDTAGKATFAGSTLTLGGSYDITVEPITFQGQEMAFYNTNPANGSGTDFFVGVNSSTQTVTLTNLDGALYVTAASNQVPGTITSNGVLTVTFNQPVILSTLTFGATINGGGGLSAATYTGVLDTTNTILTLTPTITTAPTGKGATLSWTWTGTIHSKSNQALLLTDAAAGDLFTGITNITTGVAVSGDVQLTSN